MAFVLESERCLMITDARAIPFVLMSANKHLEIVQLGIQWSLTWFRAAEVATYLGYAQPRVAITKILRGHHTKQFREISPFQSTCRQDDPRARYIDTEGLKMLCCKSRKPQSVSLANGLEINLDDMKTMMQETKTLAALCEIFRGEVIILQHVIGPYRVDMYLPDHNVVVECDERNHKHYGKEQEELRTHYIENALNCHWVRYDPDGKAFSIFTAANLLFRAIKMAIDSQRSL